jgi:DNA-binding transcriptional ArsR family regulator
MDSYQLQSELLKVLAHPVRLQILDALRGGEQCVCHLEAALGLRQAYVSQQLTALRKAKLVAERKEGLRVYYRVLDPQNLYAVTDLAYRLAGAERAKNTKLSKAKPRQCRCPKCSPAQTGV